MKEEEVQEEKYASGRGFLATYQDGKEVEIQKGLNQTGLMKVRGLVSIMNLLMCHYCSIFFKCHYIYKFYVYWS